MRHWGPCLYIPHVVSTCIHHEETPNANPNIPPPPGEIPPGNSEEPAELGIVHVFDSAHTTIMPIVAERALNVRFPSIGWYDMSTQRVHFFRRESTSLVYLRQRTDAPYIPRMKDIGIYTGGPVCDTNTPVVTSDFGVYRAHRKAQKGVTFRPSVLAYLPPARENTARNGLLLVNEAEIPLAMLPNIVQILPQQLQQALIRTSTTVNISDPFSERLRRANEFLVLLQSVLAVVTNNAQVATAALFLGAHVIVATEDATPFVNTGMSSYMVMIATNIQFDRTFLAIRKLAMTAGVSRAVINRIRQQALTRGDLESFALPGTAIVAACMNRNEHLVRALPTWFGTSAAQIVVVDWGSAVPVAETLADHLQNPRLLVLRVNSVYKWVLSHAYNLGIRMASFANILKVDCDSLLAPDIVENHPLDTHPHVFYSGNWRTARDENETHTNGVLCVQRADFMAVNGYNEYIVTYGYDDSDLYERLQELLPRRDFARDAIIHIPHDDASRVVQQLQQVQDDVDVEIERNRLIAERFPWTSSLQVSMMAMTSTPHQGIPTFVQLRTAVLSVVARDLLLQEARRNKDRVRRRLYAIPEMGLGNRLRALASLYVISHTAGREFVLVWTPDIHCAAAFSDIFSSTAGPMNNVRVFADTDVVVASGAMHVTPSAVAQQCDTAPTNTTVQSAAIDIALETLSTDIVVASSNVVPSKYRTWAEEDMFLRTLALSSNVADELGKLLSQWDFASMIGIHIRLGQDPAKYAYEDTSTYDATVIYELQRWREASAVNVFAAEMRRVLLLTPGQMFYVASDTQEAITTLLGEFGDAIIKYHPRTVFDRSVEQLVAAAVDLYALGATREIWGSNWSSFTEIACRVAGITPRLAGRDF